MRDYLVAYGYRGKLTKDFGVTTPEAYQVLDEQIKRGVVFRDWNGLPMGPVIKSLVESPSSWSSWNPMALELESDETLTQRVAKEYGQLCDPEVINEGMDQDKDATFFPSPFGDFIELSKTGEKRYLMKLSHCAFPKPGLATDMAVVIKLKDIGGDPHFYLVTGVRKHDPGKGKPAWFGGFRDIERDESGKFVFESGMYTVIREASEEAGLFIAHSDIDLLRTNYSAEKQDVTVRLEIEGKLVLKKATIEHIDTYKTSDLPWMGEPVGGELLDNGSKRVYATDEYMLFMNLGKFNYDINPDRVGSWLKAGDDIKSIKVYEITDRVLHYSSDQTCTDLRAELDFGIEHHGELVSKILIRLLEGNYLTG